MPRLRRRVDPGAPERAPRIVLRFAVLTALGLAAAGAAILMVVRHGDTVQAERHAIDRAKLAVDLALRSRLVPADVSQPVAGERRQVLDDLFAGLLVHGSRRVSLRTAAGLVTYSTDHRLIGNRVDATRAREAVVGKAVAYVERTGAKDDRVLATLVPVVLGSERATGVVVLEQDYGPIAAEADDTLLPVAGVLEGVLILLFVILVPMLARVSRRIHRHVAELDEVATHDDLTGLPNQRGFRRAVLRATAAARRSRQHAGVVHLALHGAAEIDDALGHGAGDVLHAEVAARLRHESGAGAVVARLERDAYAVLVPETNAVSAVLTARRIRDVLLHPYVLNGVRVGIGASGGVAMIPEHGEDADAIVRRAAIAGRAAHERQSDVELYDPAGDAGDVGRLALAAELREAIAARQLVLHYQPQVDLDTGKVRGVEALVRWQHPQRGLLGPDAFIPLAERTGLIKDLGRTVLDEAAAQWRRWRDAGLELAVSVNLTAVDLLDLSLPEQVAETLTRHAMPPSQLVIELTESALMSDQRRAVAVLQELRSGGVRLAIDDFGTGHASLGYVSELPVHEVKIDRSFVAGIPALADSLAVVRCAVDLAHGLGLEVVAEGLETPEQWACLAELGCRTAQGYLISKPLPADELTELAFRRFARHAA